MPQFPDSARKVLASSPFVSSVSESHVTFTAEFKRKAVEMNLQGLSPRDVFIRIGIDVSLFLDDYPKKSIYRWKKIYEAEGFEGLEEKRGKAATGRPKRRFDPNNVKDLQRRLMELEAENFILKKLNALAEISRSKKGSK